MIKVQDWDLTEHATCMVAVRRKGYKAGNIEIDDVIWK